MKKGKDALTSSLSIMRNDNIKQRSSRSMNNRDQPSRLQLAPSPQHNLRRGRTINSTTLIPKCSSCIVFNPILASPNLLTISEYGAFSNNSTLSYHQLIMRIGLTATPSSDANCFRPSALSLSSAFLVPPIIVKLIFLSPERYSG
jgi:hypothetical protein